MSLLKLGSIELEFKLSLLRGLAQYKKYLLLLRNSSELHKKKKGIRLQCDTLR